jgi:hypothetical protein
MSLTVIYRLSDNGYAKEKFAYATKFHCLYNFCKHFPRSIVHILVDDTNLKDETLAVISGMHRTEEFASFSIHSGGSSAASWRNGVAKLDSLNLSESDYVYFCEDDYIHRQNSMKVLLEGLARADYVSLYDHADKYIPASKGGNPYIDDDGTEETRVGVTESCHWKLTNSTTMTLATSVKVLKEDRKIWDTGTSETYPHDFNMFIQLRQMGRSLITPIPGYSTHCEEKWKAPLIDWSKV